MEWIEVTPYKGERMLINMDHVMNVFYNPQTDLTHIEYSRSNFSSIYIEGNIEPDIKRLLSCHQHFVSRIGD